MTSRGMDHEYAPIAGAAEFCNRSISLALGEDSPQVKSGLNATVQVIGHISGCSSAILSDVSAVGHLRYGRSQSWICVFIGVPHDRPWSIFACTVVG
jgi:aspartate/tyrosine/aromatic aminotransferase